MRSNCVKYLFFAAFSVYSFFTASPTAAKPGTACVELLGLDPGNIDSLEILVAIEEKVESLSLEVFSNHSENSEALHLVESIRQQFELLVGQTQSTPNAQFQKNADQLTSKLQNLIALLHVLEQRQTLTDLEDVIDHPEYLAPERIYSIESMDENLQGVSFSEDVLENIFWSEQPLMQRASELIFRGLMRGRRHATDKSGIIAFENDRDIFKVKITGDVVGAIRVAGFFVNTTFHIVSWSNESSHNTANSQRLTLHVRHILEKLKKTGRY